MDIRQRYETLAPLYDAVDLAELLFKRAVRPQLFKGLSGLILDAGAGTGRNVPYYPPAARVVATDISPGMLAFARRRCAQHGKTAAFAAMDILQTGFPDHTFDAVIAAFVFGVIDDRAQAAALAELRRVCKPGGEVRIVDYALSPRRPWRLFMEVWQPWQNLVYGGSFERHTERYVAEGGLELLRVESVCNDMIRLLVARPATAAA